MRRLCLCLSFLLAAVVVAPNANAQGGLNLNQTYRDVIRLDFPAGQTQIPLPEGEWELLGLQEDQGDMTTRIWRVFLGRMENGVLLGKIYFNINHDLPQVGWAAASFCDRDKIYYIVVNSNKDSAVDCWAVNRVFTRVTKRWPESARQMRNTILSRDIEIPPKMVRAIFYRRNTDNLLTIAYYFHRYPPSVPSITRSRLKSWAREWKPKVDAGFLGELEVAKRKETFAPPEQTPKAVTLGEKKGDIEARLTRLKKLFDESLITDSEYTDKRQEILKGF
ncbi:MAG: SHOCT domain-containing protein [Proteobacteria bacterium]|nr:SHOCT domain-containing protein [Pseudomonadota bacterium]